MVNTPEEDAVQEIFDILNEEMGAGGSLHALGVRRLVMDEPGAPYENWIGVMFGGGAEKDTSGLTEVIVLVDLWSQEVMVGAANNHLVRFKERVQECRQLIRRGAADLNRALMIGTMDYPVNPHVLEDDAGKKHNFHHVTITVPVTVGGGI